MSEVKAYRGNDGVLSEFIEITQAEEEFPMVCRRFLEKACETFDVSSATVVVSDFNTQKPVEFSWNRDKKAYLSHLFNMQQMDSYEYMKFAADENDVVCYDAENLKRNVSSHSHKSTFVMICTIKYENKILAYFGLASEDRERLWTESEKRLAKNIARLLGFLLKEQMKSLFAGKVVNTLEDVMNNIGSYVLAVVNDTDEIVYENEKLEHFTGKIVGKYGHDVFGFDWEKEKVRRKNNIRAEEQYSEKMQMWFSTNESLVTWQDGRIVRLMTLNDITEKIEYERLIERQLFFDSMTGLKNKQSLVKAVQSMVYRKEFGYIALIDLDNFKTINDSIGHETGDLLIKTIADYFQKLGDDCGNVEAYRYGGDEFVIIIRCEDKAYTDSIMKKLMEDFSKEWEITSNASSCYCTCSIGFTGYPHGDDSVDGILKRVDMAVGHAKKLGRSRFVEYDHKIGEAMIRQMTLERLMRVDVKNNCQHFEAYYQPIIQSSTKELAGCEALMRWNLPEYNMISPAEFIPIAENHGYINELGDNIIRIAALQCKEWNERGLDIKININLSVGQLVEPDFVQKTKDLLNKCGAPMDKICFEVTESLAINDMDRMKYVLKSIKELGITIALDDFGTGFSSLNCIKEMPLSTIKIDKTLIDDIEHNPDTAVFVQSIVNLSHSLNMAVCAEGVEKEKQFELLKRLNTDVIQGYYFGKPMTAADFENQYLLPKVKQSIN